MTIRITTLTENTAFLDPANLKWDFLAEYGLSILVEVEGLKILFDTGFSISAARNAHILGIDLSSVDKIVLSHGHNDHTGGLREILGETGKVEVIAHPDIWDTKYACVEGKERFAGIPFRQEELESLGASFNLTREPVWITDNLVTTGEVPMTTDYEKVAPSLFVREGGAMHPDPLADDLALIIKTEQGLVVILGCAHRGIINTLRHAQNLTGENRINAVIGGTHLTDASEAGLEKTIADLRKMEIKRLGACHCTGFHALARLSQEFSDTFFLNNAGTKLEL